MELKRAGNDYCCDLEEAAYFNKYQWGNMRAEYLITPAALDQPDLPMKHSSWIGHVPFAYWLVDKLRPRIIVELGVHHGVSYLSFCQAVARLGMNCRCYGIDHWRSDAHSNYDPDRVLSDLRGFHDPRYASFSTLKESSFDDAASTFADGSIDLLHIDGYHSYESVRHDYETWRPKLSKCAVVLFHDITVEIADFGVHRFWAELKREHVTFEFSHSCGLGVMVHGDIPVDELAELFSDTASHGLTRDFFSRLGNDLERYWRLSLHNEQVQKYSCWRLVVALRRVVNYGLGIRSRIWAVIRESHQI